MRPTNMKGALLKDLGAPVQTLKRLRSDLENASSDSQVGSTHDKICNHMWIILETPMTSYDL